MNVTDTPSKEKVASGKTTFHLNFSHYHASVLDPWNDLSKYIDREVGVEWRCTPDGFPRSDYCSLQICLIYVLPTTIYSPCGRRCRRLRVVRRNDEWYSKLSRCAPLQGMQTFCLFLFSFVKIRYEPLLWSDLLERSLNSPSKPNVKRYEAASIFSEIINVIKL